MNDQVWFIICKVTSLGRTKNVVAIQGTEAANKELQFWKYASCGSKFFKSIADRTNDEHRQLIHEATVDAEIT